MSDIRDSSKDRKPVIPLDFEVAVEGLLKVDPKQVPSPKKRPIEKRLGSNTPNVNQKKKPAK